MTSEKESGGGYPFQRFRFTLETLDPVHVGAGGYRLGGVDLAIAREPGTRLPKLPGTGLSGAIRHYAALRYGKPSCSGQGIPSEKAEGHCRKHDCPICYTFGSAAAENEGEAGSMAGTVRIFDARILLYPVYSSLGPVWVTSPETLTDCGVSLDTHPQEGTVFAGSKLIGQSVLNLGWLMVAVCKQAPALDLAPVPGLAALVRERWVIVSDSLFSQIVNSNLEVRTSVSIDPRTGAAKTRALFTYEAIPRATYLWMDVVENDFRKVGADGSAKSGPFPVSHQAKRDEGGWIENSGDPLGPDWNSPIDVVRAGLEWLAFLGAGGMSTRGFGRLRASESWPERAKEGDAGVG